MVEGHEDDIDHDAERDEQLSERIKHQDGEYLKKETHEATPKNVVLAVLRP